jgi:uncharacterized damage-inducible protein DinB
MAPGDLLRPLEGQRDETLRLLSSLSESDLEREEPESGWTVRQHLSHIASAELGEAFVIRMAAQGDLVHMSREDRDEFNQAEVEKSIDWTAERLGRELEEARAHLHEVFEALSEEDLDRPIRWPDWPARTIRTTIPYMLEHEDSHLDLVRRALGR